MKDDVARLLSPKDELLQNLIDKKAQIEAMLGNCHGLPFAVIGSDTHPKLQGIWCDNGLAGIGQVAVVTHEFHPCQAESLCALANAATAIPVLIDEIFRLRALKENHDAQ